MGRAEAVKENGQWYVYEYVDGMTRMYICADGRTAKAKARELNAKHKAEAKRIHAALFGARGR